MTFKLCKITSILLCAVVVMLTCAFAVNAGNILGDVDSSGEVTITDVTNIQRSLVGLSVSSGFSESAADVDGNGKIEITDAAAIQMWLAYIETPYSIGEQATEAPTQRPTDDQGWGRDIFQP